MTNSEAIDILKANYPDPCFGLLRDAVDTAIYALSAPPAEPEWHDCDPNDKNTLPEPGSWAIWCDKEDHKIIARWKEDAIDHFWPDQRMFDFDLEDAVAWTEIPKRMGNTNDIDALKELPPAEQETKQQTLNIEDVAVEANCYSLLSAYDWLKILQDLYSMGFAFIRRED